LYHLTLAAGDFLHLTVEQLGVDVVARLEDGAGRAVLEADSPSGARGVERLQILAGAAGPYRLRVRAFDGQRGGRYRLAVVARRPATGDDRRRAAAAARFAAADASWLAGDLEAAAAGFDEAGELWRRAGDPARQGDCLDRLGRVYEDLGDWPSALRAYRRARQLYAAAGDVFGEAFVERRLGRALVLGDDAEGAIPHLERAAELHRRAGDLEGQAVALNDLGLAHRLSGRPRQAVAAYDAALNRWQSLGDDSERAVTLHNLGVLFRSLGEPQSALDYFRQAEAIYRRQRATAALASTLDQAGMALADLGRAAAARDVFEQALALRREAGDRRGEAISLVHLGRSDLFDAGDLGRAEERFTAALEVFRRLGDRQRQARTLTNLGWLYEARDEPRRARDAFLAARDLDRQLGDPLAVRPLLGLARAERRLGRLLPARRALEEALDRIELVRDNVWSPRLRAAFLAAHQSPFKAYVELLMELDRRQPAQGFSALALAASERARARSLLDLVSAAGGAPEGDVDPALTARERRLQAGLNDLARRRAQLAEDGDDGAARLRRLVDQLARTRAEIRRRSPRYAALTQPPVLSAGEIQRRLLDGNAALLEYALGSERSFLWLLTSSSLHAVELPPAATIEGRAREVYRLLSRGPRREAAARLAAGLCELSTMLLAPVAGELAERRLLIVGEGELLRLPFAALPDPRAATCNAAQPLVARHEIVSLPSASVLAALRRARAGRPPPTHTLAVIADPVLRADDPRLPSPRPPEDPARAWPPLPFARREAESILALVPEDARLAALGFAADKALITSGRLASYHLLHVATHGVVEPEEPALSALALSAYDHHGRPRDGRLYAHEIYGLELAADLVALSACRTALGRELAGEGLWGLTQGFFYAGAARVLVSLWRVDDQATAELMASFYRHLLAGEAAPTALRRAQLSLAARRGWRAPYYWAAFVLQGEWR
ncbi:MAG: CHAT domain-containing protein, partial [Acidobacteria bacterium]